MNDNEDFYRKISLKTRIFGRKKLMNMPINYKIPTVYRTMLPETITKLETIKPETAKLEARKEIRKNLIRYLARCSIEHLKRKTLAMCIHIW